MLVTLKCQRVKHTNFCSNLSFLSIRNGCCVSTMRMNHTGVHRDAKCHNLENEERKN